MWTAAPTSALAAPQDTDYPRGPVCQQRRDCDESANPDQDAEPVAEMDERVERVRRDICQRGFPRIRWRIAMGNAEGEDSDTTDNQTYCTDPR